jgi:hypothetical protein
MNTLAEILSNYYEDQGIQDLDIFYDSFLFNLKIKDSPNNYNILLIEKIQFDYSNERIDRIKNPITLNFGDTGTNLPYYSNGNCFIKSILNKQKKNVYLIGVRQMQNGNTIPVVYLYDINNHIVQNIFPKQKDIDNFNGFSNYSFKNDNLAICNIKNDKLYMVFQTNDGTYNYINSLSFRLKSEICELETYESIKYSDSYNIQFINVDDLSLTYKINNYYGTIKRNTTTSYFQEDLLGGLALDDSSTFLGLDGIEVLGLDQ